MCSATSTVSGVDKPFGYFDWAKSCAESVDKLAKLNWAIAKSMIVKVCWHVSFNSEKLLSIAARAVKGKQWLGTREYFKA